MKEGSTSPRSTDRERATGPDHPAEGQDVSLVSEFCTALSRTFRTTLLYPPTHAPTTQSHDALKETTSRTLGELGSVDLEVQEDSLQFRGTTVHRKGDSRMNRSTPAV